MPASGRTVYERYISAMERIAVLAFADVPIFELAIPCEVFGIDRTADGVPRFDIRVVAACAGPLVATTGLTVHTPWTLEDLAAVDLVIVPGWEPGITRRPPEPALAALRAAHERGARVVSFCSGAFVLAAAGLLDGRTATTHWKWADELAAAYPALDVRADVLYVGEEPIWTSAGTAAGIDLCLHLVRLDHGAEVANTIARRMVVSPHRTGGQAQFVDLPVPPSCAGEDIGVTLAWAEANLAEAITVDQLARHAAMSPRTFARRFVAATGTTPLQWLNRQRVIAAQRLLETTDLNVDRVAEAAGLGTAANLRLRFRDELGVSPHAYRETFTRRSA